MRVKVILILLLLMTVTSLQAQGFAGPPLSLYSDVKAHAVGDVVTVLIVENAKASRESAMRSNSETRLNADGSVTGTFTEFLPLFGAGTAVSNTSDDTEGTQQKDQLTAKLTATLVEQNSSGLFKIEGERNLEVNGEENVMRLEGYVRGRDIGADNTVYSYNIANANIVYRKDGIVNKVAKPGAFTRWLTWGLGAGLLVAAVVGAGA